MNYLYSGFNFWKCDSLCWLSVVVTVSGIGEQGEWVTVKENIEPELILGKPIIIMKIIRVRTHNMKSH